MSEDYRDEVDDFDRKMLEYVAWSRQQARLAAWWQWLMLLGLLSFNGGFVVWNLGQLRQGWAWIHAAAVVVHSVTALYLAWKLWQGPPGAGEEGG